MSPLSKTFSLLPSCTEGPQIYLSRLSLQLLSSTFNSSFPPRLSNGKFYFNKPSEIILFIPEPATSFNVFLYIF